MGKRHRNSRGAKGSSLKDVKHLHQFGENHPVCDEGIGEEGNSLGLTTPVEKRKHSGSRSFYSGTSAKRVKFAREKEKPVVESAVKEKLPDDELPRMRPYDQLLKSLMARSGVMAKLMKQQAQLEQDSASEEDGELEEVEEDNDRGSNGDDDRSVGEVDEDCSGGDTSGQDAVEGESTWSDGASDDSENTGSDCDDRDNDKGSELDDVDASSASSQVTATADPMSEHFAMELPESVTQSLQREKVYSTVTTESDVLGSISRTSLSVVADSQEPWLRHGGPAVQPSRTGVNMHQWKIRPELQERWQALHEDPDGSLSSPLQQELFPQIFSYRDLLFTRRTAENANSLSQLFCLHTLNHVLKAHRRLLKNNAKLKSGAGGIQEDGLRDQGWTQPRILVIVPFRHAALRYVEGLLALLSNPTEKVMVGHKKRFLEEYGEDSSDSEDGSKPQKPESYRATFVGNVDDNFKLGISVRRKSVRLYTEFYSSDIIVASPLGLRTVIGAEGDKKRDYDFLSSIEVVVVDQADVLLMQNWEHVLHLFAHLNLKPRQLHGADITRVRMWLVNECAYLYRQIMVFSSLKTPEINSLMNRFSSNYAGRVIINDRTLAGRAGQVMAGVEQRFARFHSKSFMEEADARFRYFTEEVLPLLRKDHAGHIGIFVSSYFDFVRLRNYFKKEGLDFAQICEYTSHADMSRARTYFFHGQRQFLLFTERFYFFKRYRLRGLSQLVFYQLPTFGEFYPQLLNMIDGGAAAATTGVQGTSLAVYSRFDADRLAQVVGTDSCHRLLRAKSSFFSYDS